MEFAGDVTRKDMQQLVEDSFGSSVWNAVSRCECDIEVKVDRNFVPTVALIIPERIDIRVEFETVELMEDDVVVGYEFKPTIINPGIREEFADDAINRFNRWAEIAKIALDIYEVEVYPYEYFD